MQTNTKEQVEFSRAKCALFERHVTDLMTELQMTPREFIDSLGDLSERARSMAPNDAKYVDTRLAFNRMTGADKIRFRETVNNAFNESNEKGVANDRGEAIEQPRGVNPLVQAARHTGK